MVAKRIQRPLLPDTVPLSLMPLTTKPQIIRLVKAIFPKRIATSVHVHVHDHVNVHVNELSEGSRRAWTLSWTLTCTWT